MKTYRVITKAGVTSTVQAFGYTEDKTFGRIFFHQDECRSDKDNFFFLTEVAGVIEICASWAPEEIRQQFAGEKIEHQIPAPLNRRNGA